MHPPTPPCTHQPRIWILTAQPPCYQARQTTMSFTPHGSLWDQATIRRQLNTHLCLSSHLPHALTGSSWEPSLNKPLAENLRFTSWERDLRDTTPHPTPTPQHGYSPEINRWQCLVFSYSKKHPSACTLDYVLPHKSGESFLLPVVCSLPST